VQLLALSAIHVISGIGLNYRSHIEERGRGSAIPMWQPDLVQQADELHHGPNDPIHLPSVSEQFDWEAELGVIIGRRCRTSAHRMLTR